MAGWVRKYELELTEWFNEYFLLKEMHIANPLYLIVAMILILIIPSDHKLITKFKNQRKLSSILSFKKCIFNITGYYKLE